MPPRYVYWTILAGGLPTAFRAAEREELLPTFQRLRDKHPDAELKYFAQGKLWASPDEARAAREAGTREARGRDWRPGGEHRDPRQTFKDEKKADNQRRRQERFDRKEASGKSPRPAWTGKPPDAPKDDTRPPDATRPAWTARPPSKQDWKSRPPRDGSRRPDTRGATGGTRREGGDRPPFDRPTADRPRGDRKDWRDEPPRNKPHDRPYPAAGARPAWSDRPAFKPDWKGRPPQGRERSSDKPESRGFQGHEPKRNTRFDTPDRRDAAPGEGRTDWRNRPPVKPGGAPGYRDKKQEWRPSPRPFQARDNRPDRSSSGSGGGGVPGGEGRAWKDRPPQAREWNKGGDSRPWKKDPSRPDREPRGDGSPGAAPPRPDGPRGHGGARPFQGRNRRS